MTKGHWRHFWQLGRDERLILVEAWCLLPLVDGCLRAGSFEIARRALGVLLKAIPRTGRGKQLDLERFSWLVKVASQRWPWPIRCLPRAIVLEALLRRSGVDCALQIGARREDGELRAHAWVEHEGRPIGEASDVGECYPPLSRNGV
jgi:hypothetical protein